MSDSFRPPREEDAGTVARLTSESWPEPVDEASVLREWTFPGVQLEHDAGLDGDAYAFRDGFAMCHPHAVQRDLGWVRILGVRRSSRGRGLGRALLLNAFSEFRRHGMTRARLGVDAESLTGANKLYESVGMRVSDCFGVYEKVVA